MYWYNSAQGPILCQLYTAFMSRIGISLAIATGLGGGIMSVPLFAYCNAACSAELWNHQQRVNTQHQQQQREMEQHMSQQQNAAPPPPPVPGYKVRRNWGALAYSPSNGVWWQSSNLPKKNEAGKSVLSNCSQQSGGACQLMITYSNQCAAVARASDGGRDLPGMDSVNTGSNRDEAGNNALRSCQADWGKSCSVILSACSIHQVQRTN